MAESLKNSLLDNLNSLDQLSDEQLLSTRYDRLMSVGNFKEA